MRTATVASDRLELELDADNPLNILSIRHGPSGREIARKAEQRFLVRMPKRLSDPYFLTDVTGVEAVTGGIRFTLADDTGDFSAAVRLTASDAGMAWAVDVEAPGPIWMVEWHLSHLELQHFIVPALGGQMLGSEMPGGTSVAFKYPFWWQAQCAIGEVDDRHGLWLRTMDAEPHFKMLRIRREESPAARWTVGLGIEAEGPLEGASLSGTWYLDGYEGGWKQPARVHRDWMAATLELEPVERPSRHPGWAKEIDFILEIWAMSKESPDPMHTFDEIVERTRDFARHHDPRRTLLYLPGFAEEGIDSNAPDYAPAPKCGGREGFRRLVDAAHGQGYRVMIHTNVLALAYSHPLYERFRDMQVVDCFGRRQGWGNDMDGDWLHEPYFAYMNPGYTEWGDHMSTVLGDLITSFELDAVFLDQTLLAFNVGRGPHFVTGMRTHVERLQRTFPNVLFAGEGFHEMNVAALPMAQIHGIDSIAGIHGLEGARDWRHVHPISAYLFSPYTRLMAHLLTKHPTSAVFDRQERAYEDLGVIPALVLYDRSQPVDVPQLQGMIDRARQLRERRERIVPDA